MNKRVLVIQRTIKHYRLAFYESLFELLGDKGIALEVVHGDVKSGPTGSYDAVALPSNMGEPVPTHDLLGGRLVYQAALRHVRRSDLVVYEQANRNLISYWLMLLSAFGRKRIGCWGHGFDWRPDPGKLSRGLRRLSIRRPDWWFAYTEASARYVISHGFDSGRVTTVNNSSDTTQFRIELERVRRLGRDRIRQDLGLGKSSRVALFCGSMYRDRHLDLLFESVSRLKDREHSLEFVIIGGGPEAPKAARLASQRSWVHYLGPSFGDQKARAFSTAEIFLHPGVIGLGVIDAMCAGLPIVTTEAAMRTPESSYVEDGINALVTSDQPHAFVEAANRLLSREADRLRLQSAALKTASELSVEAMAKRFSQGIVSCLALDE